MAQDHETGGMEERKIRLVILEDGTWDRRGMEAELSAEEDIELVGSTANPAEALGLVRDRQVDVAIIDLRIHDDYDVGATTIAEMKQISPQVKCVVATNYSEIHRFLPAFDAGAEAFVKKDPRKPRPSLPDLARLVVRGGHYYDPQIVKEMRSYLDVSRIPSTQDQYGPTECPLTQREREVLLELAQGHTNEQIATALVITVSTVKTHIASIKRKLGTRHRHEVPLIAVSRGWISGSNEDSP